MTNSLYFSYRPIWDNRTNKYDLSYYNDLQYKDFVDAWLTKVIDWDRFIPSSRITKETVPWIKTLRRFWVLKYVNWLNEADLRSTLENVSKSFWIAILTAIEMKAKIRDYTDLVEEVDGKFLISPATNDWIDWPQEAKYLEIV